MAKPPGHAFGLWAFRELRIGRQIDPGVPWTHGRSAAGHSLHIMLKSGNFGAVDFFTKAFGRSVRIQEPDRTRLPVT
ncbi:nucleotide-binding domain containing protein [Nocardia brevicatena]|uniref:nucleotide-binding domain containing protein n=1 Tax=Nocardia brevicatena TaxID=37327 RepID=UPI0012F8EF1D